MTAGANERYLRGWIAGGVLVALAAVVLCVLALTRVDRSGGAVEHARAAAAVGGASSAGLETGFALPAPQPVEPGAVATSERSALREPDRAAAAQATARPAAEPLGVRVIDAAGRSRADLEVVLLRVRDGRETVLERARWSDERARHELAGLAEHAAQAGAGHLAVGVLLARADAPRERLWPAAGAPSEIELCLGAEAALDVLVLERGGGPTALGGTLRVQARGAREGAAALELPLVDARARVLGLEPERELDVELRVRGRASTRGRARVGVAGSVAELQLELAPPGPTLAFTLLDPAGAPAPRQRLRATLAAPGAKAPTAGLRSDVSGRVEWALAPLAAPAARELLVACDLPDGRASARVPLPPLQAGALLELAVPLRLEFEPLLASGWVRDETGAPLRSARVRAQAGGEDGGQAGRFETRSGVDGRFELRGRTQATTASLLARADGHVELRQAELALPALEQSLELRRAGALHGKLALPDEFPPEALTLELTSSGEAPRRFQPAQDGSFVQRGLPPGRWELQLRVGREWPCAQLAELEISAGGLCEDPRLLPWDLRRRLGLVEVELVDAEGAPVPFARVRVLDRPAEGDGPAEGDRAALRRELVARAGWLRIPTSYASVDVEFHADGKRARRERFLFDGARVELSAALRARVELGSAVPALAKGQALWIALAPARPPQGDLAQFTRAELERSLLAARARIGRNGRSAPFPMPAAGRYALRMYVGEFKNTKRSRLVLQREVELGELSDTQVWRMRVDAKRVSAWLESSAAPR